MYIEVFIYLLCLSFFFFFGTAPGGGGLPLIWALGGCYKLNAGEGGHPNLSEKLNIENDYGSCSCYCHALY